MSETIRIVLQVLGAIGAVVSFFFLILWSQRQKIEETAHMNIEKMLDAMARKQDEFESTQKGFLVLLQEQAMKLTAADAKNSYMKETVQDLKLTVTDLRECVQELAKAVAVLSSKQGVNNVA